MDINDLDLDINNYNMKDLETFFHILPNQNYTASDIEEKEYTMRTLLLSSGEVDKKQQKDLIDFLNLAKDWLIFVKCNKKSSSNDLFDNKPNTRTNELTKRKETVYLKLCYVCCFVLFVICLCVCYFLSFMLKNM